jgi:hypothetical protein
MAKWEGEGQLKRAKITNGRRGTMETGGPEFLEADCHDQKPLRRFRGVSIKKTIKIGRRTGQRVRR